MLNYRFDSIWNNSKVIVRSFSFIKFVAVVYPKDVGESNKKLIVFLAYSRTRIVIFFTCFHS